MLPSHAADWIRKIKEVKEEEKLKTENFNIKHNISYEDKSFHSTRFIQTNE